MLYLKLIIELLSLYAETLTLKDAPGDWLKKTLKAIWIILTSVHKSLTNHSFSHLKDILLENCQWTGRTDDLEHCLRYYLQPDNNYVIYTLLYVTAVFENAITNVSLPRKLFHN